MSYTGSSIGHELEYVGSDLFSSRCLLFKSLHKVKWFVDYLAKGQKIGRHGGAAASMAVEIHLTEEEALMPGGRAGEDIAVQDLLNDMVGLFSLAIHLRMVGRTVQQASTKVTKQVLPKITHKSGITVRNNAFGCAKDMDNMVQKQISCLRGCDTIMDRGENHTFGGMVSNSNDTCQP